MNTSSLHYSTKALAHNNITSLPLELDGLFSMITQKGFLILSFSSAECPCIKNLLSLGVNIPSQVAFTVSIPNYKAVYYNNTLSSDEILFALAHEYGHICLSPSTFCGILGKSENPEEESEQERESDDFALNLLAPICILSKLKPQTIGEIQKLTLLSSSRAYIVYNKIKNFSSPSSDEELITHNFHKFIQNYRVKKYRKYIIACIVSFFVACYFYHPKQATITTIQSSTPTSISLIETTFSPSHASISLPESSAETSPPGPALENFVVATQTGKRYHVPSCFHIKTKNNLRKLSVADAKAEDLTPCQDCIEK